MPKKKKLTTHQLKHDAFIDRYQRLAEWVIRRKAPIFKYSLRVIAILAVLGLILLAESRREVRAARKMAEAVEIFNADVGTTAPVDPTRKHFPSEEEKYKAALASFQSLSSKWYYYFIEGRDLARYYAAVCQLHLDASKGQEELKKFSGGRSSTARLASLALAESYAASGRFAESESLYRKLVNDPGELPKPPIELALARVLQYQGKTSDAVELCVRIATENRSEEIGRQAAEQLAQFEPSALERLPPENTARPPTDRLAKYKKK